MVREEKVQAVQDIKERFERSRAVFMTEYRGLSVAEQQALRRSVRSGEGEYKVVKMSLARRAADELELSEVSELLFGPVALAFAEGDPVVVARALADFADEHERLVIKAGLLAGDVLAPEQVARLARIEPREVLLAHLAGAVQSPLANLASLLEGLSRNTAWALSQLVEKKEAGQGGGEVTEAAPAEGPAAEEEPAEGSPSEESPSEESPSEDPEAAETAEEE